MKKTWLKFKYWIWDDAEYPIDTIFVVFLPLVALLIIGVLLLIKFSKVFLGF